MRVISAVKRKKERQRTPPPSYRVLWYVSRVVQFCSVNWPL